LGHPLFSKGVVDGEALERVRAYLSAEVMAGKFVEAYRFALATQKVGLA
jgi:hypothetical protein